MNLRILKKLCKRVAPVLPLIEISSEQFLAERWDNYHEFGGNIDRKHWERHRSVRADSIRRSDVMLKPQRGDHYICLMYPAHPLKGTPMIGGMVGYYEPEWEERCTWAAFTDHVWGHFTDWENGEQDEYGCPDPIPPRKRFRTTRDFLAAIPELIDLHRPAIERRAEIRRQIGFDQKGGQQS